MAHIFDTTYYSNIIIIKLEKSPTLDCAFNVDSSVYPCWIDLIASQPRILDAYFRGDFNDCARTTGYLNNEIVEIIKSNSINSVPIMIIDGDCTNNELSHTDIIREVLYSKSYVIFKKRIKNMSRCVF